ncbi:hypothetical protein PBAL39_06136 [Pedobacter sp. BAL39]|nr:hypothetical protein PBAL39_06136 [Pedobacter sp. BAL39]
MQSFRSYIPSYLNLERMPEPGGLNQGI